MFLAFKHRKLAFKSPLQTIPRKEGLHVALKGQWWGFRTFFKQLFWSEELGGRFQYSFNFHLHLGKWSNLIHIFWMGWNHQLHMSLALKRFHVCFFPKAAAKGSFKKSAVIKHCYQTLPKVLLKWWLSWKIVIKDCPKFCWSDGCL